MKRGSLIALCTIPPLMWIACWFLVSWFVPDRAAAGQFGDMFGAVNALFSGLAIAGLFATYLSQQGNHRAEMKNLEAQLRIESRRVELEGRPIFTLRWQDTSGQQDKSQFGLIVSNHGGPVILLQYSLKALDEPDKTEGGGIFQSCLNGKDVESPNVIPPLLVGILEYTYVQLRDGIRGTATFDVCDSRHREPRFVAQHPGFILGSSLKTDAGTTWDNLPRLDVFRQRFDEDLGPNP